MVTSEIALGMATVTLTIVAGLAIYATRGEVASIEGYLTARESAGSGTLTATLIASAMGVWILLSPAEAGAAFGGLAAVAGYAVGSMLPMGVFAAVGPRIRALIPDGHSLTEYALARYGRATYVMVLVVSVMYMFIFLAAEFTAIAQAFALVADVPRWQTAGLIGGFVLVYTAYGGLQASIITDTIQTLVILPLLAFSAAAAVLALGGGTAVYDRVVATEPALLDPTFVTGLEFGVWVGVAILGAELVNQSWWQRIYAARDRQALRRGFAVAAVANAGVVFLAGLFGVMARGMVDLGVDGEGPYRAGVAFFVLLQEALPSWIVFGVVLLALMLVMSTSDTLFNALASVVTADLPRVLTEPSDRSLRLGARSLTVVVAIAAIGVSLQARSVLRLFLFADLLGAAIMVPLFLGLYTPRLSGHVATLAGLAGITVGLAYFPQPVVRSVVATVPGLRALLPAPSFLVAFLGAAGVSTAVTLVGIGVYDAGYRYQRLATEIRRFDESSGPERTRSDSPPNGDGRQR